MRLLIFGNGNPPRQAISKKTYGDIFFGIDSPKTGYICPANFNIKNFFGEPEGYSMGGGSTNWTRRMLRSKFWPNPNDRQKKKQSVFLKKICKAKSRQKHFQRAKWNFPKTLP